MSYYFEIVGIRNRRIPIKSQALSSVVDARKDAVKTLRKDMYKDYHAQIYRQPSRESMNREYSGVLFGADAPELPGTIWLYMTALYGGRIFLIDPYTGETVADAEKLTTKSRR